MKVIDLLNKIANGEDVPQKIKVGNKIYNYETFNIGKGDNYFTAEWEEVKGYRINYNGNYYYLEIRDYNLNDTVEILEEENKIPEKLENEHEFYSYVKYEENKNEIDKVLYILKAINLAEKKIDNLNNSINSIIDYLKSKGE